MMTPMSELRATLAVGWSPFGPSEVHTRMMHDWKAVQPASKRLSEPHKQINGEDDVDCARLALVLPSVSSCSCSDHLNKGIISEKVLCGGASCQHEVITQQSSEIKNTLQQSRNTTTLELGDSFVVDGSAPFGNHCNAFRFSTLGFKTGRFCLQASLLSFNALPLEICVHFLTLFNFVACLLLFRFALFALLLASGLPLFALLLFLLLAHFEFFSSQSIAFFTLALILCFTFFTFFALLSFTCFALFSLVSFARFSFLTFMPLFCFAFLSLQAFASFVQLFLLETNSLVFRLAFRLLVL
eukprot:m.304743 g.304743  ORF g.304743 m.304743 type:complete len:299 (-) comp55274_c0_seq3:2345-3241(-)